MRCNESHNIEDECSVLAMQCELDSGHEGSHSVRYRGQWGEASIAIKWSGKNDNRTSFSKNTIIH